MNREELLEQPPSCRRLFHKPRLDRLAKRAVLPSQERIMRFLQLFKRIGVKLVTAFLLIGILPLLISSYISSKSSSDALTKASFNQLTGVREIKKSQIESFFHERKSDMQVLMETVSTLQDEAFHKLNAIQYNKKKAVEMLAQQWQTDIAAQQSRSICTKAMSHYQNFINSGQKSPEFIRFASIIDGFIKATGYYDFFVIDMNGIVVHSQALEADYKTDLINGPYKDSGLAQAFKKAKQGETILIDFTPYAPSNNEPAMFLAAPILSKGKQTGVVALQISTEKLQAIMDEREGLGKTGESYMVGSDKLMRSDSFLDPVNHSMKASFSNPEKGTADTEAVRWALAGEVKSDVIIDYNGSPVLSAAAPLDVMGIRWAILTEIDIAEAFVPTDDAGKEYYKKYIEAYGYYDLFLMTPDGYCFYTVSKEADYQTNFQDGKYANSNLGQLFRDVNSNKSYEIADFAPYAPSDNMPSSFIAQPLIHEGGVEMVVALQLSLDAINAIMQQREGMGDSGASYLMGSDHLRRSDSAVNPAQSVKNSFANSASGQKKKPAIEAALSGESGTRISTDYNGNRALVAFTPVTFDGLTWALIAKINADEALAAVKTMQKLSTLIVLISTVIIIIVAIFMLRLVMAPIKVVVANLKELSQGEGDLTQRLKVDCPNCSDVMGCTEPECRSFGKREMCWEVSGTMSNNPDCIEVTSGKMTDCTNCKVYKQANYDELQELSSNFNNFILKLQTMFKEVVQGVVTISSATTELSAIASQMSGSAENVSSQSSTVATAAEEMSVNMDSVAAATEETTTNMNIVASAAEEMSATIADVNHNTDQASKVTGEAVEEAKSATIKVQELGAAASEISKVTEVITDISGQTNLLALNATIEAARAGEAGKGFAVVANEIKDLAKQTADATGQIKSQIEGIQNSTKATVVQIQKITEVINNVNDTVGTITSAVSEQTAATDEIASNVAQAAQGLAEVNENVAQSSAVSGEIAKDITMVNQASIEMSSSSSEVQSSATELSETAEKLKDMVGGFKL